ncbi:hypothetical protein [Pseudobacteriovorax antillogorgiicola]|uniref:Uncharacterized protein n=1 Tax=Pseudobacteriovorax antillogorgiicola TaxID=1513793 RepID=A0A1Y6CQN4_9BACT|nr:hypothetical protein [Pseudobacteriovorax antillogorgiicola]TCS41257.1 hypothetical protein EDD56_1491 [Pseudobacteriovorax antillogorgiicola]SMF83727.1 hypothetical protein SAMN06296036_1491 [Pseudobacteriovorax antillogorgiicola]
MHRIIFITIFLLVTNRSHAAGCQLTTQIGRFVPESCYQNFQSELCNDQCIGSDPGFHPSCFHQYDLPCSLVEKLLATAPSRQSNGVKSWIHIEDLLNEDSLRAEYYILQAEIYDEIFQTYVRPRTFSYTGKAPLTIIKENSKLRALGTIGHLTKPLEEAAVYKRLSLGNAVEPAIHTEKIDLINTIKMSPFLSAEEEISVIKDIERQYRSNTRLWSFIKRADPKLVKSSRIKFINTLIAKFLL